MLIGAYRVSCVAGGGFFFLFTFAFATNPSRTAPRTGYANLVFIGIVFS